MTSVPDVVTDAHGSSAREDGGDTEFYRDINQSETYFQEVVKRSFKYFEKERLLAEQLTHFVEGEVAGDGSLMFGDPYGTRSGGIYKCKDRSMKQCSAKREQRDTNIPRRVTLFKRNPSDISIILLDWDCARCIYRNLYRGVEHGIFPGRYGIALSLRTQYRTCYNCRFTSGRLK